MNDFLNNIDEIMPALQMLSDCSDEIDSIIRKSQPAVSLLTVAGTSESENLEVRYSHILKNLEECLEFFREFRESIDMNTALVYGMPPFENSSEDGSVDSVKFNL